ncbi:UNVERIFIED_CONTAM: hypothetical protein RMT77_015751 [Armadillidium vulgare]|nr:NADH dehydrogenase [ubiquinone] 1 alpha subcomplex subunit 6 [Armadillidium vulgare]
MASSRGTAALKSVSRQVRPILSTNKAEAKRRVLNLYKSWYRQIPYILLDYHIPKTKEQCEAKLREKFEEHRHVEDIRVIDMLVVKGQMELQETVKIWKQKHGIMDFWRDTAEPKPQDFLSKFLDGQN